VNGNGMGQGRIQDVCRELINSVHQGMAGLSHLATRENIDPNSKIIKVLDERTGQMKMVAEQVG
jgi:hypothetical protein